MLTRKPIKSILSIVLPSSGLGTSYHTNEVEFKKKFAVGRQKNVIKKIIHATLAKSISFQYVCNNEVGICGVFDH